LLDFVLNYHAASNIVREAAIKLSSMDFKQDTNQQVHRADLNASQVS